MKAFKLYLKEGGNAVESVVRIHQENTAATIKDLFKKILPKLKIKADELLPVGSINKKLPGDSSGDIDLALDIKAVMRGSGKHTLPALYDFLFLVAKASTATSVKDSRGLGLISFAFPITNLDGKQSGKNVQIDFFLTDSLDFSAWSYYGPGHGESELKGLHRNLILGFVAKYAANEDIKVVGAETTVRKRYLLDLTKGLVTAVQSREGKRGLVKDFKTIDKQLVSQNPDEIVSILFGSEFRGKDMNSFESIFKVVNSPAFINTKHKKDILRDTKQALLNMGYPIPTVLDGA